MLNEKDRLFAQVNLDRHELELYDRVYESTAVEAPAPDLVVVTSFNEFHENTHVEPSVRHGDAFIRETRRLREALDAEGR